jgi:hypothetical protein
MQGNEECTVLVRRGQFRFPSCRCRAGGRPEAARRAGLEGVEEVLIAATWTATWSSDAASAGIAIA